MSPEQGPTGTAPHRVRVTSSRRRATRHTRRTMAADVSEQTELGEVYVAGLMRAQLRLSLSILLVGVLVLGSLTIALELWPAARALHIGPVPFPWVVLGVLVYPAVFGLARYYVRASESLESAFIDVVNKS